MPGPFKRHLKARRPGRRAHRRGRAARIIYRVYVIAVLTVHPQRKESDEEKAGGEEVAEEAGECFHLGSFRLGLAGYLTTGKRDPPSGPRRRWGNDAEVSPSDSSARRGEGREAAAAGGGWEVHGTR